MWTVPRRLYRTVLSINSLLLIIFALSYFPPTWSLVLLFLCSCYLCLFSSVPVICPSFPLFLLFVLLFLCSFYLSFFFSVPVICPYFPLFLLFVLLFLCSFYLSSPCLLLLLSCNRPPAVLFVSHRLRHLSCLSMSYTVKKVSRFPVPSRDDTKQTFPGREFHFSRRRHSG